MARPRQFSLAYLFLEIFWIALALGLATQAFRLPQSPDVDLFRAMLLLPAIMFAGAAVGGFFGRMTVGFLVTYALIVVILLAAIAFAVLLLVIEVVFFLFGL